MGKKWVNELIREQLEEAKESGNVEEVRELEQLIEKKKERGLWN